MLTFHTSDSGRNLFEARCSGYGTSVPAEETAVGISKKDCRLTLALSCRVRCTKGSPAVEGPWDLCAGGSIYISNTYYILYTFRGNGYI